jgi:FMN phosphatase YigB (HAD superfamily)
VIKLPASIQWVRIQAVTGIVNDDFNDGAAVDTISCNEQQTTVCEKMLSTIKGIIFDFDGTLYDHRRIAFRIVSANLIAVLRIWKERLVRSRFAGRDFLTEQNYYRAFFTELGKACYRPPERLRSWYFNHFMPSMVRILKKHYKPRPGLQELLQYIESPSSTLRVAVYSDYPMLKKRMEALGLNTTDKIHLYGPESFGAQKPAARPFLQIAKNMGLQPEEILVIGDREDTDGIGAFKAGMRFFCLETGCKRYYRFDPFRRKPNKKMHGPTLLMYAGAWDGLINLLLRRVK